MIKREDVAWVAGILEGEGCFRMTRQGKGGSPEVRLSMGDLDIVERYKRIIQATQNIFIEKKSKYNPKHKDTYLLQVCGGRAAGLMMTVLPFMGLRRSNKIKEVLLAWKSIPARSSRAFKQVGSRKKVAS